MLDAIPNTRSVDDSGVSIQNMIQKRTPAQYSAAAFVIHQRSRWQSAANAQPRQLAGETDPGQTNAVQYDTAV
jgi:hypothetical protein